jgi:hypothetical protein
MKDADLINPVVEIAGAELLVLLAARRAQGDHPIRLFMADTGLWRVEFLAGYWLTDPEQSLLPLQ